MTAVTFDFFTEAAPGIETTWRVTADVTREHGRYFADLTGAAVDGTDYDLSDLESALVEDGRTLPDVEQAAIDAYCDDDGLGRDADDFCERAL